MKVDLVWITPKAEELIAYIARVSNSENQDNPDYAKLIKYLIKHKHFSPFEMVDMCLSVTTSMPISKQMIRHRSFFFQEFSARYSELSDFESIELRKQSINNRQSSTEVFNPVLDYDVGSGYETDVIDANRAIDEYLEKGMILYKELLKKGAARETARMILPQAVSTHLYMKGTIRSWMHYIEARIDEHAQKEHQLVAQEAKKIFIKELPTTSKALGWIEDV